MSTMSRAVVARFRRFVNQHLDRPVAVPQMCRILKVNERTLRVYCAQHLGMSPKQYHALRRMQRVRQRLRAANPAKVTVAEIATRHGFRQLGWFSVRYRELFGESPSLTLRTRGQRDLPPTPGRLRKKPARCRSGPAVFQIEGRTPHRTLRRRSCDQPRPLPGQPLLPDHPRTPPG
jgi:AraC-like DNA-binding protein